MISMFAAIVKATELLTENFLKKTYFFQNT
jgi:hypothetical protein